MKRVNGGLPVQDRLFKAWCLKMTLKWFLSVKLNRWRAKRCPILLESSEVREINAIALPKGIGDYRCGRRPAEPCLLGKNRSIKAADVYRLKVVWWHQMHSSHSVTVSTRRQVAGIKCVIQPGGSCVMTKLSQQQTEHGMAMILRACVTSATNHPKQGSRFS